MTFRPISGLFSPGEGPGLRLDAKDSCAFEESGRWRSTRCESTDVTSRVQISGGDELGLCAPHAEVWAQTPATSEGLNVISPLDPSEEG
ncbi:hypothetical protein [Parafrankia sp. FMc2]|uniref:hypothetical protein n=1 Tax=Parafrankia sp. FMc2 TaxID=3233196 RepID=UPI0034D527B2